MSLGPRTWTEKYAGDLIVDRLTININDPRAGRKLPPLDFDWADKEGFVRDGRVTRIKELAIHQTGTRSALLQIVKPKALHKMGFLLLHFQGSQRYQGQGIIEIKLEAQTIVVKEIEIRFHHLKQKDLAPEIQARGMTVTTFTSTTLTGVRPKDTFKVLEVGRVRVVCAETGKEVEPVVEGICTSYHINCIGSDPSPNLPGAAKPTSAGAIPSFGIATLTLEQRNDRERRNHENKRLADHMWECLAQQKMNMKEMQMGGHPSALPGPPKLPEPASFPSLASRSSTVESIPTQLSYDVKAPYADVAASTAKSISGPEVREQLESRITTSPSKQTSSQNEPLDASLASLAKQAWARSSNTKKAPGLAIQSMEQSMFDMLLTKLNASKHRTFFPKLQPIQPHGFPPKAVTGSVRPGRNVNRLAQHSVSSSRNSSSSQQPRTTLGNDQGICSNDSASNATPPSSQGFSDSEQSHNESYDSDDSASTMSSNPIETFKKNEVEKCEATPAIAMGSGCPVSLEGHRIHVKHSASPGTDPVDVLHASAPNLEPVHSGSVGSDLSIRTTDLLCVRNSFEDEIRRKLEPSLQLEKPSPPHLVVPQPIQEASLQALEGLSPADGWAETQALDLNHGEVLDISDASETVQGPLCSPLHGAFEGLAQMGELTAQSSLEGLSLIGDDPASSTDSVSVEDPAFIEDLSSSIDHSALEKTAQLPEESLPKTASIPMRRRSLPWEFGEFRLLSETAFLLVRRHSLSGRIREVVAKTWIPMRRYSLPGGFDGDLRDLFEEIEQRFESEAAKRKNKNRKKNRNKVINRKMKKREERDAAATATPVSKDDPEGKDKSLEIRTIPLASQTVSDRALAVIISLGGGVQMMVRGFFSNFEVLGLPQENVVGESCWRYVE